MRAQVLALACLRHGLPATHGRSIDQLPAEWTTPFESTLITALNRAELTRAFQSTTKAFLNELAPPLAERLSSALRALPAGLTLFH